MEPDEPRSPQAEQTGAKPATTAHAGLRPGAIGLPGVLMQGIAHTAPATAILLTLPFIASHAGLAAPLAYLIAVLIMLMLGVSLTQLAKHMPSSGGYYTYVSRTVGPRAGFLTAWLFFLYTALTPAFSLAMMGWVLESALRAEYGITFPWWVFLLLGGTFTFWATYRRIEVSAAALTVLGLMEMGIVVFLAGWGLVAPGPGGISLASFNPAHAPSGNGLYLGIIFSLFAMTGWEGVVPLAEESRNPAPCRVKSHRLHDPDHGGLSGLHLVGNRYRLGYGRPRGAGRIKGTASVRPGAAILGAWLGRNHVRTAELDARGRRRLQPGLHPDVVRDGAVRGPAAVARDGPLATRNPRQRRGVPGGRHLRGGLALGFLLGPDQAFYVMGTVLTLALALIYSAGNLGVFLLYRRRGAEFRPILHALFPLVSTVAVLWVAWKSIVPLPPPPLAYAPVIMGLWLLAGVTVLIVSKSLGRDRWLLAVRNRPRAG